MLKQQGSDNKQHVVCYASRTCTPAEQKLSSTHGELLALVWAFDKFHAYVAGTPIVMITDNQAVAHLESTKNSNPKLVRSALKLSCYDYKIKHRAGKQHGNADGLTGARQTATAPPLNDLKVLQLSVDADFL